MAVPNESRIYVETVKGLDGCLAVGKNIDVPTCVVIFCVLLYMWLNGIYLSPADEVLSH